MSVVNEKSTEMTNISAVPPVNNAVNVWDGVLRNQQFNYTRAVAGDATSVVQLCKLPAGKITILLDLSYVRSADQGSTGTIDIGYAAHTTSAGVAVAASAGAFVSALDNSGQADAALFTEALTAPTTDKRELALDSRDGIVITMTVNTAAQQVGTVVNGRVVYVLN